MNKIFIFFICSFLNLAILNSAEPNFEYIKSFDLKKDEKANIKFTDKSNGSIDNFTFSWTLYDNTNLVIHTKFRDYPRQIVLSLKNGLELYKQEILASKKFENRDLVELYLEFVSFNNAKAELKAYILDKAKRVEVEYDPDVRR